MDRAHGGTDEQIEALERRISREYGQAAREMRALLEDRMARYASELEQRERALDDTPEARRAHREWLRRRAADREWVEGMVDSLEGSAMDAHGRAMGMVEDRLPRVYAENADWAAFEVDRAARVDTAFTLTDEDTVRQLMGRGELLFEPPHPDAAKVKAWTDRKLTSAITQGILRGESVPHVADRVAEVCGSGRAAAVRTARTACTGAENAGRVSSYQRARRLGIGLRQEWMATLDGRTRDSHRLLDGERAEVGERFSNGLRFPGDPQGLAAEVYNCRCTLVPAVDGVDQSAAARFSRLPEGMTYEDWKEQARDRMEAKAARRGSTYTPAPLDEQGQAVKWVLENNGIRVTPDNTVTLYHATPPENVESIMESGFRPTTAPINGGDPNNEVGPRVFFGADREWVERTWAGQSGTFEVLEVRVPVEYLQQAGQNVQEIFVEGTITRTLDGTWIPDVDPSDTAWRRRALKRYLRRKK